MVLDIKRYTDHGDLFQAQVSSIHIGDIGLTPMHVTRRKIRERCSIQKICSVHGLCRICAYGLGDQDSLSKQGGKSLSAWDTTN